MAYKKIYCCLYISATEMTTLQLQLLQSLNYYLRLIQKISISVFTTKKFKDIILVTDPNRSNVNVLFEEIPTKPFVLCRFPLLDPNGGLQKPMAEMDGVFAFGYYPSPSPVSNAGAPLPPITTPASLTFQGVTYTVPANGFTYMKDVNGAVLVHALLNMTGDDPFVVSDLSPPSTDLFYIGFCLNTSQKEETAASGLKNFIITPFSI